MIQRGAYLHIVSACIGIFAGASVVFASQSSTNYQVVTEQIDSGGNIATSTNYRVEGTIGPFVEGLVLESDSFSVGGGGGAGAEAGGTGTNEASPEVSSVIFAYTDNGTSLGFATGITPAIGTTTVHVYGTVVDVNGVGTITNVTATLYRSGLGAGASCTTDTFNCYRVASCTVTPTTSSAAHYDCAYSLASYVDATDAASLYPSQFWTARVTVTDSTAYSSYRTNDIEMNSLAALNIPELVDFGTMSLSATTSSSTNQSLTLVQIGNAITDVMLSSSADLSCQIGTIPRGNVKWSITDVDYTNASTTSFTASPVRAYVNVPRRTTPAATSSDLYFNLGIPATGVRGTCTGTMLLSITQGP